MSSIDAVVFDIGNVLIEWDRDRLYGRLIPDETERREFFENVMTMEVNLALDAGAPFGPTLATLAEEHPHLATEIVAFEHCWSETLGPQDDAMISLVRELLANGVGVFALTNFSHETWPIAVARCPWLGELDGIVVSGQEGVIKPDREIYNILLSRYRLDPARTWLRRRQRHQRRRGSCGRHERGLVHRRADHPSCPHGSRSARPVSSVAAWEPENFLSDVVACHLLADGRNAL